MLLGGVEYEQEGVGSKRTRVSGTSHTASGWDVTRLSVRRGRPPAGKETS